MIIYLLKSASCLALLLFFYHLVLEKEKMHQFNRYFLIVGVLLSLTLPLATITVEATPVENTTLQTTIEAPIFIDDFSPIIIKETIDYTKYLLAFYLLIASLLLFRFGRNIFKIIQKISKNTKVNHKNATLILVEDPILPHSFWNWIFINKIDYKTGKIEEELFTHELTHITQKHTFDVLLIELIQAIFWINPLFIFIKKAMQLNHEFLADETVIKEHKNTFQYQHLLLNKAAWNNEYYLASNLNYSLTKKRLKMMTTQSSKTKIWLKKLAVIPLLTGFVFLFTERVEAQTKDTKIETIYEQKNSKNEKLDKSEIYKDYAYRNLKLKYKDKNGKYISKTYKELSAEEKKRLVPPPPLKLKKILPTKAQFEALKDNSKFAVWIDGKVVDNAILNNYKHTDFARYFNSFVHKNARSKRFPQKNQASLDTHAYFEAQNKKRIEKFNKFLKEEYKVEEIKEEPSNNKKLKKDYIDSPIPTNTSSKQSIPENISYKTDEILKLKDVNALNINYIKDTITQATSATKKQMEEYVSIVSKRKKTDIFKVKEINTLKKIYSLMSDEQKKSVINVNDFIKKIPILKPKADWLFTYQRLAHRIKTDPKNRKANLTWLETIYTQKMSKEEKLKVTPPNLLVPQPPIHRNATKAQKEKAEKAYKD